jgi:hypothetical protein
LLDPALLRQATTDQTNHGYSFGFYTSKDGIYGHGGGAPGFNAEIHVIPRRGYVVVARKSRPLPGNRDGELR